ncbi:HEAT repeat domain-containing protein [Aquipuribacter nitratireducens]|uniref:HEAT repeat domain-containing protein n=1 Tax=Aquipuribacter nitratireducens TaxID=650104 RepID=A0ABW0GIU0_9MICO
MPELRTLAATTPSARLAAAMAAGARPHPDLIEPLVQRCSVEPDAYVRDMLSWALIRQDRSTVVDRLLREVGSPVAQARSQALHTLSKLADVRAWPVVTRRILTDRDDDVARAAWRAAITLVPEGDEDDLAAVLASQLGRGDRDVRLSLSRALVALGASATEVVRRASRSGDDRVRAHALATQRLAEDPSADSEVAVAQARRVVALHGAPVPPRPDGDTLHLC